MVNIEQLKRVKSRYPDFRHVPGLLVKMQQPAPIRMPPLTQTQNESEPAPVSCQSIAMTVKVLAICKARELTFRPLNLEARDIQYRTAHCITAPQGKNLI
jgi:hypothetical protein